jgi:hypothetical protein
MRIEGERLFLFIDETGDPGHPDNPSASKYYYLNIIVSGREGVAQLTKHLSAFRYFNNATKELKRYSKQSEQLKDIFQDLQDTGVAGLFSFGVDKAKYVGPYLKRINKGVADYNAKKFRNYVVRMSLECLFNKNQDLKSFSEIEIVFDRYLENEEEQISLTEYLRNNYRLPNFFHILQVDSEYCDPVQAADYLGRIVKEYHIDRKHPEKQIPFVKIFEINNPDQVKEKRPDTLE